MRSNIVIGKMYCGYTQKARQLLDQRKINYTYFEADDALMKKIKKTTVPQIRLYNQYIGGYSDLVKHFEFHK